MTKPEAIDAAASLASTAASIGAHRLGLGETIADEIGHAVEQIVAAILKHHDPLAISRDLAAEAAHRAAVLGSVQAALDAAKELNK